MHSFFLKPNRGKDFLGDSSMAGSVTTFFLEGALLIVGSMLDMKNSRLRAKVVSSMLVQAIVGIICFFTFLIKGMYAEQSRITNPSP